MSGGRTGAAYVARLGLLAGVALVLGYVEKLFPVSAIPGIKLGLSNTVLLYALCLIDVNGTFILMALKVAVSGILFGGPVSMIYSAAGGLLSVGVMLLARRIKAFSLVGVSVAGALAHNVAQTAVACFAVESGALAAYLPVLLISAALTGPRTGTVATLVVRALGKAKAGDAGKKPEGKEKKDKEEDRP